MGTPLWFWVVKYYNSSTSEGRHHWTQVCWFLLEFHCSVMSVGQNFKLYCHNVKFQSSTLEDKVAGFSNLAFNSTIACDDMELLPFWQLIFMKEVTQTCLDIHLKQEVMIPYLVSWSNILHCCFHCPHCDHWESAGENPLPFVRDLSSMQPLAPTPTGPLPWKCQASSCEGHLQCSCRILQLQLDLALPSPPARVTCLWATYEPCIVQSTYPQIGEAKQSNTMNEHLKQSRIVHSLL